jgi:pimeloyl-ACP methyl ester carboxylesterase
MLGYKTYGNGKEKVLALHDWFCDSSSYDPVLSYLDTDTFTYVFPDLRGYGKSKSIQGECTVEEASQDLLALIHHLKWDAFHFIGHSMCGMIAQYVAALIPQQIKSVVAITPVPASGSPAPEDVMGFLEDAANTNDESARQIVHFMTGNRHNATFVNFKVKKWRETSEPQARIAYLHMFAETNFENKVKGLKTPFLVIIGAHDAAAHQENVMKETFVRWYPHTELVTFCDAGHYPMQESPVTLASTVEKFMQKHF